MVPEAPQNRAAWQERCSKSKSDFALQSCLDRPNVRDWPLNIFGYLALVNALRAQDAEAVEFFRCCAMTEDSVPSS